MRSEGREFTEEKNETLEAKYCVLCEGKKKEKKRCRRRREEYNKRK